MSDKRPKPTQRTPQGEEIPVPSRDEFFKNLGKVAPKVERDEDDDTED